MTIHYHGLPITPLQILNRLRGRHFCISYATKINSQVSDALGLAQSIMFDNGAFTFHRKGGAVDPPAFYRWLEPMLGHPHWAVIPDVIDGDVAQQRGLLSTWPFPKDLGAAVWHLGLPLDWLDYLVDSYPKVCLGSSGQFWKVGAPDWEARMDVVFDHLMRRRHLPWIHGLRMMAQAGKRWPLASVDSVNVARNYNSAKKDPAEMADRIDAVQAPVKWPNPRLVEHFMYGGDAPPITPPLVTPKRHVVR